MPKKFRRTGVKGVTLLAAVALVGCKNYDVKYQPFNPRGLQEPERTSATGAPMRPQRALPTTLETEFPIEGDATLPAGAGSVTTRPTTTAAPTTAAATSSVNAPPATGPAIGAE